MDTVVAFIDTVPDFFDALPAEASALIFVALFWGIRWLNRRYLLNPAEYNEAMARIQAVGPAAVKPDSA